LNTIAVPETVEFESLESQFKKADPGQYELLYFGYRQFQRAIRHNDMKLIEYMVDGVHTTQMFDLVKDPWEMNNLANDSTFAEELERMRAAMLKNRDDFGDSESEFWEGFPTD
jgi:arylsulfatase A-like enzyme